MPEGGHRFAIRVYYEDTDAAGIVYHAFSLSRRGRRPTAALKRHSLAVEGDLLHLFPTDNGADLPLPALVESAAGLGVVNFLADPDGTSRRVRDVFLLPTRPANFAKRWIFKRSATYYAQRATNLF